LQPAGSGLPHGGTVVDVDAEQDHGGQVKQKCGAQEIRKSAKSHFLFLLSRFHLLCLHARPTPKRENLLVNLLFNALAPFVLLTQLSKETRLGPFWGLVVSLLFPSAMGSMTHRPAESHALSILASRAS